jgi:hypothetical protein
VDDLPGVDDADKTAELVKKAGGMTFVEPMDVMDAGGWRSSLIRTALSSGCGRPVSIRAPRW